MHTFTIRLTVMILAGFLAMACSVAGDEDSMMAEEAVEGTEFAQTESAITAASVQGVMKGMPVFEAARYAAQMAKQVYHPADCVTTEVDGATVTYTLDGCSGPWGLANVSGTLMVTYVATLSSIEVEIDGDLTANRGSLLLDIQGEFNDYGDDKVLEVSSQSVGTGPRGYQIERSGEFVASFNVPSGCVALDGEWARERPALNRSLSVSGFEKCPGSCPSAGGTIEYYGSIRDRTITVEFDGSDLAAWTSSLGPTGTVNLFCNP